MIHGYHVILPCYGFWLPNDPRGSWSDVVRKWELLKFGESTCSIERRELSELSPAELASREQARKSLTYEPVNLTGLQAASVGKGFANRVGRNGYTIWACSILPDHTHLVIARHHYRVERIVNLLKGAATTQLIKDDRHPFAHHVGKGVRPPRMWAEHEWKVYLDSEEAIENAIQYVIDNPVKEDKPAQTWSFVTPFEGIPSAGWTTYH